MARIEDNSEKIRKELDRRISRLLTTACIIVERRARQIVHRKTGSLARSITHEVKGKIGRVGTNLLHGPWVELGTRPHKIKPRSKKALFWEDLEHPIRSAMHPGARAYPYLRPALHQSKDEVESLIGKQE